ncbi:hypothetical protein GCM10007989_04840 [Devosia pacifica]|uniref:Phage tail protein n=1 Tax=Devosia pacifica TaxID=1335967 RepID=A0A918RUJ5_9HYPH|nr:phage major tail tube protein [Devosia pacifica]GHA13286.1 hypothetical protein GCM10007989_04840 [Devosia pacifica]
MQPLYLLTAVDLRRATETGSSRAATISSLTLPSIQFANAEHNPGGGVGAVNFAIPRIQAPEPKFSAKGIDRDIFRGMGQAERWTFAGAYREKRSGGSVSIGGRGIIEGAITMWEPDESDPAEFQGCNHSFTEVTHYELTLGDEELFYWDFWERVVRVAGVDLFADERRALGA